MGNPNPPLENLTPFKPGESGNPEGRKPGRKNLATYVRDMLEDEEFDWESLPVLNPEQKDWAKKTGAPWKVLISAALTKAFAGDTKCLEWLRKSGYGDKLDITSDGKALAAPLIISPIQPRNVETETETAGSH